MTDTGQVAEVHDPLGALDAAVGALEHGQQPRQQASAALREIAESAASASRPSVAQAARLLARLADILALSGDNDADSEQISEIVTFLRSGVPVLRDALQDRPEAEHQLEAMVGEAAGRWAEWLELVEDEPPSEAKTYWELPEETPSDEEPVEAPSAEALSMILAAVSEPVSGAAGDEPAQPESEAASAAEPFAPNTDAELPAPLGPVPAPDSLRGELLEAYSDDAQRCLAAIEASLLACDGQPGDRHHLRQVCRELHTLKGASASVGIGPLAEYLHQVEEFIQSRCDASDQEIAVQPLLEVVDVVRGQLGGWQTPAGESAGPATNGGLQAMPRGDEIGHAAEETVRVKASQLDRLMDMLAELVMLRNGRESRIAELHRLNDELIRCATRLRVEGEEHASGALERAVNPMREVASDVLEISRGQREICDRVSAENLAVSRFIRNFRQELTEVRRLPISGLFSRLQRAVHDAARAENKQVQLQLMGEHAGLERSLQERLYEPLLHIVRNAVGHGIETAAQRTAAGKEPCGTITLEARGTSNLLILDVRDDGRGLDYDALRRRGVERGLLSPDQAASREELAQLIFQPGFSTREAANSVAGRGVGMDVVAEALGRMRAWVEVESRPGEGTTMRLSIPLRTVIEHTMVFRYGGQLFGLPMQAVRSAGEAPAGREGEEVVCCEQLLGRPATGDRPRHRLTLAGSRKPGANSSPSAPAGQLVVPVDEIVGPEEVVVRPLPPLLRLQSLVVGVTLAGSGELLLLLDGQRLIDMTRGSAQRPQRSKPQQVEAADVEGMRRVLIVDDSISARRCLARIVQNAGCEPVEAADGKEALQQLRQGEFAAVFSDLEMPGMSGFDLLRAMDADDTRQIPVTIVSSRQEEPYREEATRLGAITYLNKPVTDSRVYEVLQRMGLVCATQSEG